VFNVLVRDDGATVSLQEGRLQVDSVDASQSVELLPGDVAFAGLDGVLRVLDVQLTDNDANVRAPAASSPDTVNEAAYDVAALVSAEAATAERTYAPLAPAVDTVVKNVEEPTIGTVTPVVRDVAAPLVSVADTVVSSEVDVVATPMVDNVLAPVVNDVVPVVDTISTPVIDTVTPVVDDVVAPAIDDLVTPVVEPVVVPVDVLADPVLTTVDRLVPDPIDPVAPTDSLGRVLGGLF
jgi:hypothetical protein